MKLKTVTADPSFTMIKSEAALFKWLIKYMRDHSKQRHYPKTLVDLADFLVANLPNSVSQRDIVKAFEPGRLNRAFDLPSGSPLSALFQLMADNREQAVASESLIDFVGLVLHELADRPVSLGFVNMQAIDALGLMEYGAFRLAVRDDGGWLVTTRAGQEALKIKVAIKVLFDGDEGLPPV